MVLEDANPEQLEEGADNLRVLAEKTREANKIKEEAEALFADKRASINDYVMSDYEAITTLSKNLNINATEARK